MSERETPPQLNMGKTVINARQDQHHKTRGRNCSLEFLHSRKATNQKKEALQYNVTPKNSRRKARRAGSGKQTTTKGQSMVGHIHLVSLQRGNHSIPRRQWKGVAGDYFVEPLVGHVAEKPVKWKGKAKLSGRHKTF